MAKAPRSSKSEVDGISSDAFLGEGETLEADEVTGNVEVVDVESGSLVEPLVSAPVKTPRKRAPRKSTAPVVPASDPEVADVVEFVTEAPGGSVVAAVSERDVSDDDLLNPVIRVSAAEEAEEKEDVKAEEPAAVTAEIPTVNPHKQSDEFYAEASKIHTRLAADPSSSFSVRSMRPRKGWLVAAWVFDVLAILGLFAGGVPSAFAAVIALVFGVVSLSRREEPRKSAWGATLLAAGILVIQLFALIVVVIVALLALVIGFFTALPHIFN